MIQNRYFTPLGFIINLFGTLTLPIYEMFTSNCVAYLSPTWTIEVSAYRINIFGDYLTNFERCSL